MTRVPLTATTITGTAAMADSPRRGVSRRALLAGGAAALAGGGVGAGVTAAVATAGESPDQHSDGSTQQLHGAEVIDFYGRHQAGVETPMQAFGTFVAFDLLPGVDREALARWMKIWTDDAARLTQGRPALADTDPELATAPARLTVTVGVGPGFVAAAGRTDDAPSWLQPLPEFSIDALEEQWSGGDVVVQVCADDPVTVSHAVRMLSKDSRAFATIRWVQQGFHYSRGTVADGSTPRNLMGQIDGTTNPRPGSDEFTDMVWIAEGPQWLRGGTSLVIRRIRMDMDTWDRTSRRGKEESIGRRLTDGAPLTGANEHDEPDFDAVDDVGFTVIPAWSHIRRARPDDPRQRIMRRPYNYDDGPGVRSVSDSGLIFASYQADVDAQFVPIQQRLADLDLLNEWTVPIGSAVFAVLPGVRTAEEWLGQALLR